MGGSGNNDGELLLRILKLVQVPAADLALLRDNSSYVVGMLVGDVGVAIVERLAHVIRCISLLGQRVR